MTRYRPTYVEVDLDAVRCNVRSLRPPTAELMAVVKADGYGHGAVPIARATLEGGATWLGVALVEEGIALRDGGIDAPILVLAEFPPGAERDALVADLTPTVYTREGIGGVARAAAEAGRLHPTRVHVKVDTGMHRVGVWPPADVPAIVHDALDAGLEVEGLWTHFACADEDEGTTMDQLRRFLEAVDATRAVGARPRTLHTANSAATILFPTTHLDLVRPGAALYGLDPGGGIGPRFGVVPALSWRSAVTMVKELPAGEAVSYGHRYRVERPSRVATVPVGYEDGYGRLLSSRADVLVRGKRHRVAGTVTMDHILVDCGDDEVAVGDEVVLIGEQGGERITAEELAGIAGTIGYEIVTGISERVPREYRG